MIKGLNDLDFLKENSSFGIQERFSYFDDSSVVPMQFSAILNHFSESSSYDKEVSQKFAAERMLSFMPAHFIYSQNLVSPEIIFGNADITMALSNLTLSPRIKADTLSECHESRIYEHEDSCFSSRINNNLSDFNTLSNALSNAHSALPCFNSEYKELFLERRIVYAGKNIIRYNNHNGLETENSLIKGIKFIKEDIYG